MKQPVICDASEFGWTMAAVLRQLADGIALNNPSLKPDALSCSAVFFDFPAK